MSADGNWNVTLSTPQGNMESTLSLKTNGASVSGSLASAMLGTVAFSDGKVDGDKVNFDVAVTSPMPMTLKFATKISGDNIEGSVGLGSFGDAPLKGKRA